MESMRKYYEIVMDLLKKVKKEEEENIAEAARLVSEAIREAVRVNFEDVMKVLQGKKPLHVMNPEVI